ncbi:septum site-determining protein Ssd [Nocardia sp. NPDC004068]|uniref:septum site-determining protein Ssd n=1 Tax=Nocardia sp. NPDC004068 TaxID=3364303 RepID=UPI0036CAE21B
MNPLAALPTSALVLITDHRLRDEVRRIAAAADRRLDERLPPIARHAWLAAGSVILDAANARACAESGCPRRAGTIVVTAGEPGLADWQAAAAVGSDRVLPLPAAADGLIASLADHVQRGSGDGVAVAVVGAGGGAGASVLAAAVALTAAAERFRDDTLLVDGDPLGGGLDLLLGLETTAGLRWPDLVVEDGRVAAHALHDALPAVAPRLSLLSCGRVDDGPPDQIGPGAVRAVVAAGRAAGDLVVCDVSTARGPHTDQMLDAADLVVLVVPARLRAVAAARAVVSYLRPRNPNQALVVRGPAPGGLRGADVAQALSLPLLSAFRPQPGLPYRLERTGLTHPRGPLRTAAESILDALPEVSR